MVILEEKQALLAASDLYLQQAQKMLVEARKKHPKATVKELTVRHGFDLFEYTKYLTEHHHLKTQTDEVAQHAIRVAQREVRFLSNEELARGVTLGTDNVQQCCVLILDGFDTNGNRLVCMAHVDRDTTKESIERVFDRFAKDRPMNPIIYGSRDISYKPSESKSNHSLVFSVLAEKSKDFVFESYQDLTPYSDIPQKGTISSSVIYDLDNKSVIQGIAPAMNAMETGIFQVEIYKGHGYTELQTGKGKKRASPITCVNDFLVMDQMPRMTLENAYDLLLEYRHYGLSHTLERLSSNEQRNVPHHSQECALLFSPKLLAFQEAHRIMNEAYPELNLKPLTPVDFCKSTMATRENLVALTHAHARTLAKKQLRGKELDIDGMDPKKLVDLTRRDSIKLLDITKASIKDLSDIHDQDPNKFHTIVHPAVIHLCAHGASLQDVSRIYDEDPNKLGHLTCMGARAACSAGATFQDLEAMYSKDMEKFEILIDLDTLPLYSAGASFEQLNRLYDQNPETLTILTSNNVKAAINAKVKFEELEKHINNPSGLEYACFLYQYVGKQTSIDELVGLYNQFGEKVQYLANLNINALCDQYEVPFKEIASLLKSNDPRLISELTSPQVQELLYAGAEFKDLARIRTESPDKFARLVSEESMHLIQSGAEYSAITKKVLEESVESEAARLATHAREFVAGDTTKTDKTKSKEDTIAAVRETMRELAGSSKKETTTRLKQPSKDPGYSLKK